jgi:hypothetical protein
MKITTVGIDLAKNLFAVHGINEHGRAVLKKVLKRDQIAAFFANLPACLIGMDACSGAHHWARKLQEMGHTVRLIAPQFVKPYVKTNKNDAADAEAICEAVARPNMRFVPLKNVEQQSVLSLHRVRQGFVRARTAQANQIRGLLSEFGLVIPQGISNIARRVPELLEDATNELTGSFRLLIQRLMEHLKELDRQVRELEAQIVVSPCERNQLQAREGSWHRANYCDCLGRFHRRCNQFCKRASARGMAWSVASAEFQRRQERAAWHQQAWRYLFANATDPRSAFSHASCQAKRTEGRLVVLSATTKKPQYRSGGTRQQKRPDRVGVIGSSPRVPERLHGGRGSGLISASIRIM